jgi:hypothetical protein
MISISSSLVSVWSNFSNAAMLGKCCENDRRGVKYDFTKDLNPPMLHDNDSRAFVYSASPI